MSRESDHDPKNELGYRFTLDLCDAIAHTTAKVKLTEPRGLDYRETDLAYAVERELYIGLMNNPSVLDSYERLAASTEPSGATVSQPLELAVARRLVPGGRHAIAGPPSFGRRVGRAIRDAVPGVRAGRSSGVDLNPSGPVLMVLHHPKFLRFVEPVLHRLETRNVVIASTHLEVPAAAQELGALGVHLALRRPVAPVPAPLRGMHSPAVYDAAHALLMTVRPRAVLTVEGNHPWDEATSRAARQLHMPAYCLQHGWSPIVHNGFRNMTFSEMFVWGEGFADLLSPFNPGQPFLVTGNPALAETTSSEAQQRLAQLAADRKLVAFFLQSASPLLSEQQVGSLLTLISEFATRFPDAHALVREHPSAPLGQVEQMALVASPNVTLVPPGEFPLRDILAAARSTVSMYSTTILESIAMLVPPVIYNATALPRYSPDVDEKGAGVEARTRPDVLETLDRLLHDDDYHASFLPAMQRFRDQFFASHVVDPAGRIAAILEQAS